MKRFSIGFTVEKYYVVSIEAESERHARYLVTEIDTDDCEFVADEHFSRKIKFINEI